MMASSDFGDAWNTMKMCKVTDNRLVDGKLSKKFADNLNEKVKIIVDGKKFKEGMDKEETFAIFNHWLTHFRKHRKEESCIERRTTMLTMFDIDPKGDDKIVTFSIKQIRRECDSGPESGSDVDASKGKPSSTKEAWIGPQHVDPTTGKGIKGKKALPHQVTDDAKTTDEEDIEEEFRNIAEVSDKRHGKKEAQPATAVEAGKPRSVLHELPAEMRDALEQAFGEKFKKLEDEIEQLQTENVKLRDQHVEELERIGEHHKTQRNNEVTELRTEMAQLVSQNTEMRQIIGEHRKMLAEKRVKSRDPSPIDPALVPPVADAKPVDKKEPVVEVAKEAPKAEAAKEAGKPVANIKETGDEKEGRYKDEQVDNHHLQVGRNTRELPFRYKTIALDKHLSRLRIPTERPGLVVPSRLRNGITLGLHRKIVVNI